MSAALLALSINLPLIVLIIKSKLKAITTPILSAIKLSTAEFGIILSYTVIVKIDVVKAKKFEITEAIIT